MENKIMCKAVASKFIDMLERQLEFEKHYKGTEKDDEFCVVIENAIKSIIKWINK